MQEKMLVDMDVGEAFCYMLHMHAVIKLFDHVRRSRENLDRTLDEHKEMLSLSINRLLCRSELAKLYNYEVAGVGTLKIQNISLTL